MKLNEIEERLSAIKVELDNENADIDALTEEVENLKEARKVILDLAEKRKALVDEVANAPAPQIIKEFKEERKLDFTQESKEYRSAFLKKLQNKELNEVEQRAYTSASGSAGAAIPTETANVLFSKMVKVAPMLSEITLMRVAGNVKFVTEGVRTAAEQHTENTSIIESTDTMVEVSLSGYEFNKLLYISKTVETMAIDAFEGWLSDIIAEDIAAGIENAIINGNGSTAPKGIAYAATWATASNWVEVTGTATIAYTDILSAISKLPARYDSNAKFLASKSMVYQGIAAIKDTSGRPIMINDTTGDYPFRVLGYPVMISDKAPEKTLFLGDFKKVVGNLSQDITVERSDQAGFASNSIAYRGGAIFDCDIALSDAFVKLTTATY
jgi:HK97 family phage major capsid protein